MDVKSAKGKILEFIRQTSPRGVVVGLSGGVDSSLVAALCAEALGGDKVLGLIMPSDVTKKDDVEDAAEVAKKLGIDYKTIDTTNIFNAFASSAELTNNSMAESNITPRIRMTILYYYANLLNRLVAGTGNRSEILIGYFTKFGDGGADFLPIGDLYKHEVRDLAKEMGIPGKIINKPPTAGLWHGQTDEAEIGMNYEELDKILEALFDMKLSPAETSKKLGIEIGKINRAMELHEKNKHKLSAPQIAKVR